MGSCCGSTSDVIYSANNKHNNQNPKNTNNNPNIDNPSFSQNKQQNKKINNNYRTNQTNNQNLNPHIQKINDNNINDTQKQKNQPINKSSSTKKVTLIVQQQNQSHDHHYDPILQCQNFIKIILTASSDLNKASQKAMKLSHPGKKGSNTYNAYGVHISYGINLGKMKPHQIRKLLENIAQPSLIKTLQQAAGLKGDQARSFVQKHKNILLTKQQCQKIFQKQFQKNEEKIKNIFKYQVLMKSFNIQNGQKFYNQLPLPTKKLLLLIQYLGKNTPALRKQILPILRSSLKRNKPNDNQLKKLKQKIYNACKIDQQKFKTVRKIMKKEQQKNQKHSSFKDQIKKNFQEINKNSIKEMQIKRNNLGGVDLGFNIDQTYFDGYYQGQNLISLHRGKKEDASLRDMIVPLKIYFDDTIKYKNISISIDPHIPTQPDGPQQQKIYYPPQMQGTYFASVMIEADLLMKQMKMGINRKGQPFKYPQSLKKIGIDFHSLLKYRDQTVKQERNRQWIVIKEVQEIKIQGKKTLIGEIKMGIQAKNQQIGKDGKLQDTQFQPGQATKKFCQLFTKHYDLIGQEYPEFKILKRFAKAGIIAKSMYQKGCQINMDLINTLFEKEKIDKSTKIIPTLRHDYQQTKGNVIHSLKLSGGCCLIYDTKQNLSKQDDLFAQDLLQTQTDSVADQYCPFYFQSSKLCSIDGCQNLCSPQYYQTKNQQCDIHTRMRCIECYNSIKLGQTYSSTLQGFSHSQCFACNACQKLIKGIFLHLEGSQFYHPQCIPQTSLGKCRTCNKQVLSYSEHIENALGQFIHMQCILKQKCGKCQKEVDLNNIRTINGKYYHNQCIKCTICKQIIEKSLNILNGQWIHQQCIPKTYCQECRQVIKGKYSLFKDKTYHLDCIKCKKCNQIINGDKIKFNDRNEMFHPLCLF